MLLNLKVSREGPTYYVDCIRLYTEFYLKK